MTILLFVLALVALAVLAPLYGADTSDSRSENARPPAGWWPGSQEPRRR